MGAQFPVDCPEFIALPSQSAEPPLLTVERVQTGIRVEKRLLKVLRGLAEYHDLSLGDLLEGIVLYAFEGKLPFDRETMQRITELKKIYGVDYDSRAAHRLQEQVP